MQKIRELYDSGTLFSHNNKEEKEIITEIRRMDSRVRSDLFCLATFDLKVR
jgi:hypothetical protein